MNWGKGLMLAMMAFAGLMAWLVVRSTQNPEPLVTEHYYEQELHFQQCINAQARAQALSAPVAITFADGALHLAFPPELRGRTITGELALLRPNDPREDRSFHITADAEGHSAVQHPGLVRGRYAASLDWRVDGDTLHTEQHLLVP